jgi:cation/acetate symporter
MDELKLYTWIAVGGTFGIYFFLAWWARAGSTSEFYAAGGGITPMQNGMAIGADWMSAASFISMAGLIAFRLRGLCIPNGLDWRLRIIGDVFSAIYA